MPSFRQDQLEIWCFSKKSNSKCHSIKFRGGEDITWEWRFRCPLKVLGWLLRSRFFDWKRFHKSTSILTAILFSCFTTPTRSITSAFVWIVQWISGREFESSTSFGSIWKIKGWGWVVHNDEISRDSVNPSRLVDFSPSINPHDEGKTVSLISITFRSFRDTKCSKLIPWKRFEFIRSTLWLSGGEFNSASPNWSHFFFEINSESSSRAWARRRGDVVLIEGITQMLGSPPTSDHFEHVSNRHSFTYRNRIE